MKKCYLVFIFVFTSGFLMAQFTKTITEKDGSTITITKTTDLSLQEVYSEEVRDKKSRLTRKVIYRRNLLDKDGIWEVEHYDTRRARGQTGYRLQWVKYFNEKGELTKEKYTVGGSLPYKYGYSQRNEDGSLGEAGVTNWSSDGYVKATEYSYGHIFRWLDKLDEKTSPPPPPNQMKLWEEKNKQLRKERVKEYEEKKVSIYLGPGLLNGDYGSSKESFFGGQVYGLVSVNSNIGIGADISLNSKKDGDQKLTRSLFLARGQYDFSAGDNYDKGVIPEAHILIGLGSESFKFTSGGNTSKSSGSGLAYGVGAGVGINISPNINLGISVDYIGIKFENNDNVNSNIRASAGIKIGL